MRNSNEKAFGVHDTHIGVWVSADESHPVLFKILEALRSRGFNVGSDPRIDRDYPILSDDHFAGSKGDLLFEAHKYPAGFKIEFYQEIITKNRSGGRYDFDKFEMMPYLIKKRFLVELRYIKEVLLQAGYDDRSEPVLKTAYDKVMHELGSPDRHWKSDNLPDYNALDKDGKRLTNGEVKYFRDRKGVLQRGVVYHNINNMWWLIVNKDDYRNLASFYLFDLDSKPENRAHKLIKRSGHHNPKSRFKPTDEELALWRNMAKGDGKSGRIQKANEFLCYLYEINWISREFQFVIKPSGRVGLVETQGNPYFLGMRTGERTYNPPREIPLYPRPSRMSGTESGWVENLREYVVHGKPSVGRWFCKDGNGEGSGAYHWPEVRERLLFIGASTA